MSYENMTWHRKQGNLNQDAKETLIVLNFNKNLLAPN